MKRLNVIAALMLLLAVSINAQTKVETLTEFLDGIIKFENATIQEGTPIADIKELAAAQADKMMDLNKETVAEVLETANDYHFCVITVGVHTIARITDLENCQQSGSWGQCMPMSEGFVQKNGLTDKNEYLNNIIGIPNSQERKVYFFMKK
ncbi:hypothetical protein [Carboxylicivirga caseinilyticus]|uniref:hypothetical protein n=1 Tax=Carboxylicivirga caseinilyticus TaxID=3417572 RepID=UPI003D348538|nr:hypothetical protein [Marinilabiliaceae bacterium A049]